MNKVVVYSRIEQIEKRLKSVLSDNCNADVIIHEIISEAIMLVHDSDNSCLTNEEIAQGAVRMSINSFYEASNIVKVIDKYNNPQRRIFYGLRARSVYNTENLLESIDILKKDVREERDSLLKTVDSINFTFYEKPQKQYKYVAVITVVIMGVGLLLSVLNLQNKSNEGKYVYVDDYGFVHSKRNCSRLHYKGMASSRILIDSCNIDTWELCPKCVDDKMYETLTNTQNND